jgi:hypothetical protein
MRGVPQPLYLSVFHLPLDLCDLLCRDTKNLTISFPIPAVEHKYLTKPNRYAHSSCAAVLLLCQCGGRRIPQLVNSGEIHHVTPARVLRCLLTDLRLSLH